MSKGNADTIAAVLAEGEAVPLMTEDQLRQALAVEPDNLLLRAVRQLIRQGIQAGVMDASDPGLDPSKGTHPGGVIDGLLNLRGRMDRLAAEAREVSARKGKRA